MARDLPNAVSRNALHQAAPQTLLFTVDGVARYLVSGGRRVVIDRDADATDADVLLFLMGSVLGALLHQREDLVLHGSAIDTGHGAVAFLGVSGSGKSTLATALSRRGYRVLTDDLCVIRPDAAGAPRVQPGVPQMKLWLDALEHMNMPAETLPPVGRRTNKRAVEMTAAFAKHALPLSRIYVLQPAAVEHVHLMPLDGTQKFMALMDHTYRLSFLEGLGGRSVHFRRVVDLARQMTIVAVNRPCEPFRLDELVDRLVADFDA